MREIKLGPSVTIKKKNPNGGHPCCSLPPGVRDSFQLHPCLYLQAVTPLETVDRWINSQSLHFYD